ncbi:MAG TPA: hypothetical protein VGP82_19110 [Ktedonobacterales bacterium]|nr:hypothetical protein [Ktedonobacterales bacterium]
MNIAPFFRTSWIACPVFPHELNATHLITQEHATRGTRKPRPLVRGTLILVEGGRLPHPTQPPKPLWLWWHIPVDAAETAAGTKDCGELTSPILTGSGGHRPPVRP